MITAKLLAQQIRSELRKNQLQTFFNKQRHEISSSQDNSIQTYEYRNATYLNSANLLNKFQKDSAYIQINNYRFIAYNEECQRIIQKVKRSNYFITMEDLANLALFYNAHKNKPQLKHPCSFCLNTLSIHFHAILETALEKEECWQIFSEVNQQIYMLVESIFMQLCLNLETNESNLDSLCQFILKKASLLQKTNMLTDSEIFHINSKYFSTIISLFPLDKRVMKMVVSLYSFHEIQLVYFHDIVKDCLLDAMRAYDEAKDAQFLSLALDILMKCSIVYEKNSMIDEFKDLMASNLFTSVIEGQINNALGIFRDRIITCILYIMTFSQNYGCSLQSWIYFCQNLIYKDSRHDNKDIQIALALTFLKDLQQHLEEAKQSVMRLKRHFSICEQQLKINNVFIELIFANKFPIELQRLVISLVTERLR